MSGRFYRNRRRYYRRRYYRRNYNNGRTNRKAYGNMRAAKQQADNATFTINIPSKVTSFMRSVVQLPGLATGDYRTVGVFPISIYDLLRRSEFFNNYANMYDEFKIDKIKVKLLPTSFTINTNGNYRNLTIYTAWDRTGLNTTQLHAYVDKARPENNQIWCTIGEDITTYSSAESRTVNPNTNTSITRWLNPKTMNEKAQWLSTSLLKQWYDRYDDENGCFTGIHFNGDEGDLANIQTYNQDINALIKWSAAAKDNPCFLLEDPSIKFKPTLLVGVFPAVNSAEFANNTNRIHFNVETEVVCTYRGLRKARLVSPTTGGGDGPQPIIGPKPATITANGIYMAASDGMNGYSSVSVNVPQQGGGDEPELEDNRLMFVLTDDVVETAQARNDTTPDGTSLRGTVEWPIQGGIQWTDRVVQTFDNPDAKWVDAGLVDVAQVHLAKTWSQTADLGLNRVQTTYKENHDVSNSEYPEDFNFTTESGIKFNNNSSLPNDLVVLRNQFVNCISTDINVGNITNVTYQDPQNPTPNEIQNEINANPILQPSTHGAYVETISDPIPGNPDHRRQVIHFAFELTDGQQTKTATSGGMEIDPITLPRLYARKMQGYFNLPTMQQNIVISEPGTYAIGNFIGEQNVLEVEKIDPQSSVSELPTELKLIKTRDGSIPPEEAQFTLGTFTVNESGQSIPEITGFKYKYQNEDAFVESLEDFFTQKVDPTLDPNTQTFSGNADGEDVGTWLLIYKNNNIYGAWPFEVPVSNGKTYSLNIYNYDTSVVNFTILKCAEPNNTFGNEYIETFGFCDDSGDVILPLSIHTAKTIAPAEWVDDEISVFTRGTIVEDPGAIVNSIQVTYNGQSQYYNPLIQCQFDSNIFDIPVIDPSSPKQSKSKSKSKSINKKTRK